MNEARQQIVEAIKANTNILVTVSDSPSVDELSAALGLTILLNKIDKRATSIFSGTIPPAITFLDPEKTLEGTVDSLRDFIIALDKEKADHLRYKVDGDVVKIFITPYRTTLTEKDLQFSQGDYNVELVIALNVKDQDHLDKALSAHGRILHDATVTTISVGSNPSSLGSIDWRDAASSSLCEMLVGLSEALKEEQPIMDDQIATAFLTGIVSATDRFSNNLTSSRVMTMAAQLMAAGANQQLIAAKLQEGHDIGPNAPIKDGSNGKPQAGQADRDARRQDKKPKKDDGLRIDRNDKRQGEPKANQQNQNNNQSNNQNNNRPKDQPKQQPRDEKNEKPAQPQPPIEPTAPVITADPTPPPQNDAAAVAPVKSIEDELADKLDQQPAAPVLDTSIAEELKAASEKKPAAPPVIDNDMPGFESLDMPTQPAKEELAPEPEPTPAGASPFIDSHAGGDYLPSQPATFDAPVDGIISGASGAAEEKPIDPFSVPLSPLPALQEAKDVAPIDTPPAATEPPAPAFIEEPAPVAASQGEPTPAPLPPLPSLPDFALPPPPPPPVFDQPGAVPPLPALPTQPGALSADTLGDIFGDAGMPAATPVAEPTPPASPPSPGQFRIPGQ